ncbi:MAG: hypothetical protein ACLP0J_18055 [Solirubrobacteraceae bacterium]|jgi:hypothetical protein
MSGQHRRVDASTEVLSIEPLHLLDPDENRDIELTDQDGRVTCETLEEAERVAHICAAYRQPCELVVCEAYHRLLHRDLIDANADQAAHALGLVMLAADRIETSNRAGRSRKRHSSL